MGDDNKEHRPVGIHRAIYGSFERFVGILIEHFAGNFPVWLAPIQARIITVADRHMDWAREVISQLQQRGLRVELDESSEKLGAKIGDKEVEAKDVGRCKHGEGKDADLGFHALDAFASKLSAEAATPF